MKSFENISIHADQMISKSSVSGWHFPSVKLHGRPDYGERTLDHFLVTSITDEKESFGIIGENSIRKTNSS